MFWCFGGCCFKKSVKTAVPNDGRRPRAPVLTKLVEWYRFEVGHKTNVSLLCLEEVASLAKKSRYGAAQSVHKAKIEVAPAPQEKREAPLLAPGATSVFALCPDCAAP